MALLLGLALAAGVETGAWELRGEDLRSDPRLPALLRCLEEARRESLGIARAEQHLEAGRLPLRWVLDLSGPPAATSESEPFSLGRTTVRAEGVEVELQARRLLHLKCEEARKTAIHEGLHAVLASAAGSASSFERFPRWLREGLALRHARQGPTLVGETAVLTVHRGQPATAFLTGIRSPAPTYAEAFLAHGALELRLGTQGIQALLRRVLDGAPFEGALRDLLGQDLEAFEAHALEFSRAEIARLLPPAREVELQTLLSLRKAGNSGGALSLARKLVGELPPEDPLRGTVLLVGARLALDTVSSPEGPTLAGGWLEELAASPGTLWEGDAFLLLGDARAAGGQQAAALDCWRTVLVAFGDDARLRAEAARRLEASPGER